MSTRYGVSLTYTPETYAGLGPELADELIRHTLNERLARAGYAVAGPVNVREVGPPWSEVYTLGATCDTRVDWRAP